MLDLAEIDFRFTFFFLFPSLGFWFWNYLFINLFMADLLIYLFLGGLCLGLGLVIGVRRLGLGD